jgi:DNA mismatch repair protein MutL
MAIRVLDPTVAAQIAAGEVVERPASVIRELIENALDAGARRIMVDIHGGGMRELRVQDDGRGIPADEVELAFARHATSKLSSADDLWSIGTLGFRGEALPAIASVAQVVCTTRVVGEEVGTELRIAGGEIQARAPIGAPPGTSISIRHLFYNTPVRRDFLRSEGGESALAAAVVNQYALAYPEVRFTLLIEGRVALQTSGDSDLRAVAIELYGLDVARQLLPVELQHGEGVHALAIHGMTSPPGVTRSSRTALHLFVNRRVVAPRGAIAAVVEEAYHTLLLKGRHPLAILNISVAPIAVDVNIHPTKSEVKFRDAPRVLGALGRAVREALLASGAPLWDVEDPSEAAGVARRRFELRRMSGWAQDLPIEPGQDQRGAGAPDLGAAAVGEGLPMTLRLIGQARGSYLIAESPEGIVLIDQHAADARVWFERLLDQSARGSIISQPLDPPLVLELPSAAHRRLIERRALLQGWGWEIEDFGMALRVRAAPAAIGPDRAATLLSEIAGQIAEADQRADPDLTSAVIASIARHAAVRAGQELGPGAQQELLDALTRCAEPHLGPHSRPTMILLPDSQLAREFGHEHSSS